MPSIKKHRITELIKVPKGARIGIIRALYNPDITDALLKSALTELKRCGVTSANVTCLDVPGCFELPTVAEKQARSKKYTALIALGCLIQGETPHFDVIAKACAHGIMQVSVMHALPVAFGVLTVNTTAQARARIAGGRAGDKGVEAAQTALRMIGLKI